MLMVAVILWRLLKSVYRVLLIGPIPKPPPDFEGRLHDVELICWRLDKRAQRAGVKDEEQGVEVVEEAAAQVPSTVSAMFPQGQFNGAPVNLPRR